MELKEIKSVIDLMNKNKLSEFELEKNDFKIRIARESGAATGTISQVTPQITYQTPAPLPAPAAPAAASPTVVETSDSLPTINSPMVGTFYISPSPESDAYVEVGQEVNENTIVCIIEAMKVMNEIKAEMKGTIVEIIAENAKPVEFGKPLFKIRPK
ncbi:MAG: acetyl-CoA carboxylase biotin carboxyl carrier protein [Verrucomicrobiota bacterium]